MNKGELFELTDTEADLIGKASEGFLKTIALVFSETNGGVQTAKVHGTLITCFADMIAFATIRNWSGLGDSDKVNDVCNTVEAFETQLIDILKERNSEYKKLMEIKDKEHDQVLEEWRKKHEH